MKIFDFDYELPKELIAQEPATPRDSSKLMVVDRKKQTIEHKIFRDIVDFLNKGDLLVLNNAKAFPARLLGKKEITGGKIDLLLIEEINNNLWKCLIQGSGKIKKGLNIVFSNNKLRGRIEDYDKGIYSVRFEYDGKFEDILEEIGEVPLPPYIKNASASSKKRYQTIYAKKTGAIAAPTAGFHFTEELMKTLKEKGVSIATLTLIVGRGTFTPIKTENVEEHQMDEEYFEINNEEKEKIDIQFKSKKRIIAVGTTSVRTLESIFKNGEISQDKGKTSLFIYPGYKFNVVDCLITNFHLPKSTPLLLTCAFVADAPKLWRRSGGRELIMRAYKEAINKRYRFYSFGDAMLII